VEYSDARARRARESWASSVSCSTWDSAVVRPNGEGKGTNWGRHNYLGFDNCARHQFVVLTANAGTVGKLPRRGFDGYRTWAAMTQLGTSRWPTGKRKGQTVKVVVGARKRANAGLKANGGVLGLNWDPRLTPAQGSDYKSSLGRRRIRWHQGPFVMLKNAVNVEQAQSSSSSSRRPRDGRLGIRLLVNPSARGGRHRMMTRDSRILQRPLQRDA